MLLRLWVAVLLCHSEINDVYNISSFRSRSANEEVVGLDITIDKVLLVDSLDS